MKQALDSELPDVMGFSNYTWNEELAYHFVKYVKARNPAIMTVMGGPNWPLTNPVQEQFLREKPLLDVYVDGPTYEGERALTNLMRRYIDAGGDVEETLSEPIAGNTWIHPKTQQFVKALPVERIRDLDEIPSPYLRGHDGSVPLHRLLPDDADLARVPVHLRVLQLRRGGQQQDIRALGREREGRPPVHCRARQAGGEPVLRGRQLRHVRARRGDRRLHRAACRTSTIGPATSARPRARTRASASSG